MTPTPSQVRGYITAQIAAIVVDSSYQQSATDAWRESKVPLMPEFTPEPAEQLSFFVDNRRLTLADTRANSAEELLVNGPMLIRFLYRLRAASRVADWDKADAARVALWKSLLSGWESAYGMNITPADQFSDIQVLGDWLAVSIGINVQFYTPAV